MAGLVAALGLPEGKTNVRHFPDKAEIRKKCESGFQFTPAAGYPREGKGSDKP
jgi:hypothetical protein